MCVTACLGANNAPPKRRDCIVKVDLDWQEEMTPASREELLESIAHLASIASGTLGNEYTASLAIREGSRSALFLQFKANCDDRLQMADRIVSLVRNKIPDAPPMIVLVDTVEPGPETIDVSGPSWEDRSIP